MIFTGMLFFSCDHWRVHPVVENFPTTQGTEWHYQRTVYIAKYESDNSDRIVDMDTLKFEFRIRVTKDTVLNDTMYVTLFESTGTDTSSWTGRQFYFIDEEGLKLYAYTSSAPLTFKKSSKVSSLIPGIPFEWSPHEAWNLPTYDPVNDPYLLYEKPPVLCIQLPLTEKSYWTNRKNNNSNGVWIDMQVTGKEIVRAGIRNFACFRVEFIYRQFIVDPEPKVTDWIAQEGFIKRVVMLDHVNVTDPDTDVVYTAQFTEVIELIDLSLN